MFPIRDENPLVRQPLATIALIGLNAGVWLLVQGLGTDPALTHSVCSYGLIPAELLGNAPPDTLVALGDERACRIAGLDGTRALLVPLTSMFMHGGWFHILFNLWFLWIFGDNVEDSMGPVRFVVFYLVCGLAAAAAQVVSAPMSTVPMVGASGAIGGVMGAYARIYPRARVHMLVVLVFWVTSVAVPAILMLGYWFLLQLLRGLLTLGGTGAGVAFWAHAGGFIAGIVLIGAFTRPEYVASHRALRARRTARYRW